MKRILLFNVALGGVLSLGMSVSAMAQSPSPAPAPSQTPSGQPPPQQQQMSMDQRMARLTQVLNLTPTQQQQIRPILEQAQAKMQALAADNATPMADRQASAQKIREDVRTQIDGILTPEQKQRAEMPQRAPGSQGTGAPPTQPPSQPQK